jgi:photosystem II protein PsbQ
VLVVAIAIFLVSCSSAPVAKGPVYTSAQLAQIEQYSTGVVELRDRLLEIPPLVQQQDWVDVQSFIHGPLGELRARMSRLARSLEPKVQKKALDAAKEVFEDLNLIDEATLTRDSKKALLSYNRAIQDFETFLKYVPAEALNS